MIDLFSGIVQQKCFDPECRNFQSPPIEIPPYLLEMEDEDFEKKLIQSVEKIEKRAPRRHNLSVIQQGDDQDGDENEDDDIKQNKSTNTNTNTKEIQEKNTVILSQLSLRMKQRKTINYMIKMNGRHQIIQS